MGVGLEVYNKSGGCILSITDRITKVIGIVKITSNGSVTDPEITQNTVWYYPCNFTYNKNATPTFPDFTVSGNTLLWSYPGNTNKVTFDLIYGVY